jgi:uncharacterized protein YidB (DUF937 family)
MKLSDLPQDAAKKAGGAVAGVAADSAAATSEASAAEEKAIAGLLGEGGGLSGLLDDLGAGGLGDLAQSWIGKGKNLPVDADQITAALKSEQVAAVASKLGISKEAAAAKIADILPRIIDKVTPDGLVPDPQAIAGKLGGLFR